MPSQVSAVQNILPKLPYRWQQVDLIIADQIKIPLQHRATNLQDLHIQT